MIGERLTRAGDVIEASGQQCPPWVRSVLPAASGWRVALLGLRVLLGVVGVYTVACAICGDLEATRHAGTAAACADLHAVECSGFSRITVV